MNWRGVILPASAIAVAEFVFRAFEINNDTVASPSQIVMAAWTAAGDGSLFTLTLNTLSGAGGGLLLGGIPAILIGIVLGLSHTAKRITSPAIELFRPIPSVALIPLALLVFGLGMRLETSIVAFAVFWPLLLLTQSAVAQLEPRLLEVARLLHIGGAELVRKIIIPAAMPRMFVALRQAIGISLVVAVTVEIAVNPYGLGYGLVLAQQNLQPDLMLALLLWVGALGWALNEVLLALQHQLFMASGVKEDER